MRSLPRGVAYWATAAVLWAVPVAIAARAGVAELERVAVGSAPGVAAVGVVGSRQDDGAQSVRLDLRWSEPDDIEWPASLSGVITGVYVSTGDRLVDGALVAKVGSAAVLAQSTGEPLHRAIRQGDSGPDVMWLDGLLQSMSGGPSTLDAQGRATWATTRAVRSIQRTLGHPEDGVFDPRYVMWVGADDGSDTRTVGTVVARLGTMAAGPFIRSEPHLIGAEVTLAATDERRARLLRGVPVTLNIGEASLDLDSLGFSAGDLAALEAIVPPGTTSTDDARLRRRSPLVVGSVVASALMVGEGGQYCIVLLSADDRPEAFTFHDLEISPMEPGVSYVPASVVGRKYLSSPTSAQARPCG